MKLSRNVVSDLIPFGIWRLNVSLYLTELHHSEFEILKSVENRRRCKIIFQKLISFCHTLKYYGT